METNDLVWLYISLEGEDFAEAVSVIVQDRGDKLALRWLEWGRPIFFDGIIPSDLLGQQASANGGKDNSKHG